MASPVPTNKTLYNKVKSDAKKNSNIIRVCTRVLGWLRNIKEEVVNTKDVKVPLKNQKVVVDQGKENQKVVVNQIKKPV